MKTEKGVLSSQRAGNLFFVMTVVQIAGSLAYGIAGLFFPQLYGIAVSTVFSEGLALVPMLIFAVCSGVAAGKLFPFCRIRPIQILQALLLTAAVYPVCIFLNGLSLYFTENAVEQMSGAIVDRPMWEMILLIGIAGPFCEEIIFRHLLLRPLRRYGDWLAIIFSAVCFGAFHGNFDQFAYAAFVGVFLALSAVRSNSIRNSILLHVINNLIVCLSDVLPQLKSSEVLPTFSDKIIDGMTTVISFFYTVILWVGLAAFVVMIATGMFRLHNGFTAVSSRKKAAMVLINPLLWVGIVLIVLIFMGIRI